MLKRWITCSLVLVLMLMLVLSGYAGNTVKIALVAPMTGDAAFWGNQMVKGANLAMEQINERGGIQKGVYKGAKYEFLTYDDRGDVTESTNISQQLITKDDVLGMIGPVNSSNAFAILPILSKANFAVVSGGASNAEIAQKGWKNFFRAFLNDGQAAPLMAELVNRLGHKKILVAHSNNDFGMGIYAGFKGRAEELGMEILSADAWMAGEDRDFSSMLTKWDTLDADVIFIAGEYTESAVIIKQARSAGIELPIINEGAYSPDLLDIVGEDGDGVIVQTHFNRFGEDEQTVEFVRRFKELYGEEPAENGSIGYDAFLVMHDAISRMEEEGREALVKALSETKDLQCINFNVTFDENGELDSPGRAPIVMIKDGKYQAYEQP